MIVHDAGVPAVHELEIYIIVGRVGASGSCLSTPCLPSSRTRVPVEIFPHVHDPEDVRHRGEGAGRRRADRAYAGA